MASPAAILRQYLISVGIAIMPMQDGELTQYDQLPGGDPGFGVNTPCYINSTPDEVDQSIEISNNVGVQFGRDQRSGRSQNHLGVKIFVRATDPELGYDLACKVSKALDDFPGNSVVKMPDGEEHYVQSFYSTTTVIPLGEESGKRRQLFVQNVRMAPQDQEPSLG